GVTTQPMLDSDAALHIGNRTDLVTDFLGRMDDVAIFDGGLSPDQITAIMDGDFSQFGASSNANRFLLTIAQNGAGLDLAWESQAGMLYNLMSSDDLSTWTIVEGNIPATPDINTKTISPADPARFYRIEEFPPPPVTILTESFDSAPNLPEGWTTGANPNDTGSTQWQLGNPAGGPGPAAANSGINCVGTNIDAKYGITSSTWLRSPATIDLTTATSAKLVFQQWVDMDDFDFGDIGTVRVLDAADLPGTVTELAVLRTNIQGLNPAGWTQFSKTLPPAALGKSIVLEFLFSSDNVNVGDASGWYIDDVTVTAQVF
ncbi:MAG: choice-of-anchor J domain-containing protein, partial [Verrucomicrobiales bacterium]|nr:choice-of-anchor J domain-containing protein [Verrucomicrobiales bacterium]